MNERRLRAICLCAGWCGACTEYRAVFDDAAAAFGAHVVFSWIDIEDDAALLDDVEVENFPTLLLALGDRPLFFGPITPQAATLSRLVQRAIAGALRTPADPSLQAFLQRLDTLGS
ncbi:MAG: thioredoxin domain-containing protein [Pseudomonadota bacterium]|nr:thioredoxin domain-containing protein [Pseudomonadota bacterium]